MAEPFGGGGHVGGLQTGGKAKRRPHPGRGVADPADLRGNGLDFLPGHVADHERPQTGRLDRQPAHIHRRPVRERESDPGDRGTDQRPEHPRGVGLRVAEAAGGR